MARDYGTREKTYLSNKDSSQTKPSLSQSTWKTESFITHHHRPHAEEKDTENVTAFLDLLNINTHSSGGRHLAATESVAQASGALRKQTHPTPYTAWRNISPNTSPTHGKADLQRTATITYPASRRQVPAKAPSDIVEPCQPGQHRAGISANT
jgi:hypothetical protein